jgi:hypothetical protein
LFDGVIWVDDQDFAIVKSFGKFVSEIAGNGTKLPFTMFETFRENFQNKYWLPTYTRSDDYLQGADNTEQHLRLVIRGTDFKLNATPAAGAPAPSLPPPSLKSAAPPNNPPSPN